jgi:hypothetical protein
MGPASKPKSLPLSIKCVPEKYPGMLLEIFFELFQKLPIERRGKERYWVPEITELSPSLLETLTSRPSSSTLPRLEMEHGGAWLWRRAGGRS